FYESYVDRLAITKRPWVFLDHLLRTREGFPLPLLAGFGRLHQLLENLDPFPVPDAGLEGCAERLTVLHTVAERVLPLHYDGRCWQGPHIRMLHGDRDVDVHSRLQLAWVR